MNFGALVPFAPELAIRPNAVIGPLQREIDRLFDDFARGINGNGRTSAGLTPYMDVSETDKEIEISAELPGLERGDIQIAVDDGTLTIRGEKKAESQRKDKNFYVTERTYGTFYRAIALPQGVDESAIQATMSNGVLNIKIPKPARSSPKTIEVKEAN